MQILPAVDALQPGTGYAYRAEARYADGALDVVPAGSPWQSSNPAVATIDSTGAVRTLSAGTTMLSVSYRGVTATLTLRVGSILVSLQLFDGSFRRALGIGGDFRWTVLGQYTDGARDISTRVSWTSSDPTVATVDDGLVRGRSPGRARIGCSLDGLRADSEIPVLNHRRIDHVDSGTLAIRCALAADAGGRALAVWSRGFSDNGRSDLSWSRFLPASGWSAPAPVRDPTVGTRSTSLWLSMNAAGQAVAAWVQPDGRLLAARHGFDAGFEPPQQVAAGAGSSSFSPRSMVSVDGQGNALLVWFDATRPGGGMASSVMDAATGLWSTPAPVPYVFSPTALTNYRLAASPSGEAVLVFAAISMSLTGGGSSVQAVRWQRAATGPGGRWLPPETVVELGVDADHAVDIDDAGHILIAWRRDVAGSDSRQQSIRARRFVPAIGWQAEQVVVAATTDQPRQLAAASSAGQGAGLLWANGYDSTIDTSRMSTEGTWGPVTELTDYSSPLLQVGDPLGVRAAMLQDGRFVASWIPSDNVIDGRFLTRLHHPSRGWQPVRRHPHPGRLGQISEDTLALACTPAGEGLLFWHESNAGGSDLFGVDGLIP